MDRGDAGCFALISVRDRRFALRLMIHQVRVHYDNKEGFADPRMWVWVGDGTTLEKELLPTGRDRFGVYFDTRGNRSGFNFKFKDGGGRRALWEDRHLDRSYHAQLA